MLKIFKSITQTQLFKVSSLNFFSVAIKIAGGLISSKIIALFIGPAGLALLGNFRNFLTSVESFSTLGFQNGIIKYVAENDKDEEQLGKVLSTILLSVAAAILLLFLILILPSQWWSIMVFGDAKFSWIFKVLAFLLPLYTGNIIFISIINGLGKYKDVISINIWGNIIGVLLSAVIIWKTGLEGAFFSLVFSPSVIFLLSFYLLQKKMLGWKFLKLNNFDISYLKGLLSYSSMILVTAMLSPYVFLYLRNLIINNVGAEAAGHWEAMNRIAVFYLMFFTTLLTIYFLPKLSVAQNSSETRKVFHSYFKGIVPLFLIAAITMFLLRKFIIRLILTPEFLPTADLFAWQLTGDFFKVCSLILGFEFFAKKMTRIYIAAEVMSFTVLFISGYYLITEFGVKGAVMAHAFTYFVYFIILAIIFKKKLF